MDAYIDLHRHGQLSDGLLPYDESVRLAYEAGIKTLAFTDHNVLTDLRHLGLERKFPHLTLISGTEVSAVYRSGDIESEIHILGLGVDPDSKEFVEFLKKNKPDNRPYIEAILRALHDNCGIDLCSYDDLREQYPQSSHIGRGHIAELMVAKGYASDSNYAFDRFIGAKGAAYVVPPLRFFSMEEVVSQIRKAGGVAVIAHPLFYKLTDFQLEELLARFKECGGQGMEVYYGGYNTPEKTSLSKALADKFGLIYSAGSDNHGREKDRPCYFNLHDCLPLMMTIAENQERGKRIWKHHGVGYLTENAMIEELRNRPNGAVVIETNDGSMRDIHLSWAKESGGRKTIPFSKITHGLVQALMKGEDKRSYIDPILLDSDGLTLLITDVVPSATAQELGRILNEYSHSHPLILGVRNATELYFLTAEIENADLYSYVGAFKDKDLMFEQEK